MSHQPDRNFDDLAKRFQRTIYQHPKGRLRLAALQQDFSDLAIPIANHQVLDIGGGQGQFALSLAEQGAHITLTDISAEMLEHAENLFASAQLPLRSQQCALQDIHQHYPESFDLVLNHAVLEWLEEPLSALPILTSKVAEQGYLSLMFYNLHGHVWRQLMNGRTNAATTSNPRLRKEGNAPQHPLDPHLVIQHLQQLGFTVLRQRGIRCVYDHMHQKIRDRIGEDAFTQADLEYGLKEPYWQLGRYVHLLAQRI